MEYEDGELELQKYIKVSKKGVVRNFPNIMKPPNHVCIHYLHGNKTRTILKVKEHTTSQPLEIIHIDLCGPTRTKRFQGEHYFMLLIDDYTRMTWVTFLKEKSESFMNFKSFKAPVENEENIKIKFSKIK